MTVWRSGDLLDGVLLRSRCCDCDLSTGLCRCCACAAVEAPNDIPSPCIVVANCCDGCGGCCCRGCVGDLVVMIGGGRGRCVCGGGDGEVVGGGCGGPSSEDEEEVADNEDGEDESPP